MPNKPRTYQPPTRQPTRGTAHERGYTKEWSRLRTGYIHANPLCEACLLIDRIQQAQYVDHVLAIRTHPRLRLDPGNWQSLCSKHHARKTERELMEHPRYVICGPPGAGKTTYVQQRAKHGDMVWDYDRLEKALFVGGNGGQAAIELLEGLRRAFIDCIRAQWNESAVWLIWASYSRAKRAAEQIGAELVVLAVDAATCKLRRSGASDAIDRWWADYPANRTPPGG